MLRATDYVIDDKTSPDNFYQLGFATGCVPRDFEKLPPGSYPRGVRGINLPLIPRDEWAERIADLENAKATMSHIRRRSGPGGGPIPSLDQNGKGYCWAHSATMAVMLQRAKMGLPYKRLSAYMVACIIKNYRDEGAWGALALDFIAEHGVADVEHWAEKSMSRSNDNAEMRANAKQYRASSSWSDLDHPAYDRNLNEDQAMTLLLSLVPLIGDFNWWGHSVCIMDAVLLDQNVRRLPNLRSIDLNNPKDAEAFYAAIGKRGINSWTDSWGDKGEFVLKGSKAKLDGGSAPRDVLATA